ncbi:peptidoglycan-binding domain-containing protein [Kitasatospora atroaurantiaca]|uniref:peptidoglycan-binding domain-containing protein n=1 Tax=Kitasatospora atroaurantiaca TaxID=285545 RepID=UPI0011A5A400|nr:peptidoglycan-binding domain-containing protein [Kitasatospora atroaurantiaca]
MTEGVLVPERAVADSAPAPAGRSRMARRQRAFLAVAVVAALVSSGGWAASSLIKSPAERAADAAPPPRTVVTVPVGMRVLTQSVVTRGQVYPPTQFNITPTAASTDVTQLYVSKPPAKSGDSAANGQLLAEVSGQPLFVLQGPVPAYRDLRPGSSGPDVAELQAALELLGYPSGSDEEGTYGRGTAKAVADFYRHLGYTAPTTGPATQQAVDAAKKTVEADQQQLDTLKAQSTAPTPGGPSIAQQLATAKKKVADDKEALARAEAVNGPMVPAGEVVFLPALPAAVTAVNSAVGSPVSGALLSLTSGGLAVTGQLTPGQAAGVKAGMAVEVFSEATGTRIKGTVSGLGAQSTTPLAGKVIAIGGPAAPAAAAGAGNGSAPGAGGQAVAAYVPLHITTAEPLPAGLNGQNVRITVLSGPAAEAVPSVPVAAVFTDASGQTAVTRVTADGQRVTVPVTVGVTAGGYVGVTATAGGRLDQGDQVAVGR